MILRSKEKIKLDQLGQFYAAFNSEKNPGTFSVGIHLKEFLVPMILQEAVNDLMKRLPHMNVRTYSGFLHYYNVTLDKPLIIEKESDNTKPCCYFSKGSHLLRVIYGERHFTLEVLHSVCDGRSLAMVASSLLIRYYELMGLAINKSGFIDCMNTVQAEEAEDAYARYADMQKSKSAKSEDVYVPKYKPVATQVVTQRFDVAKLKAKAKAHSVTITEYIMAHIFNKFAKQREIDGSKKGITINVPIDCRGFFPSKSLRNFVSHKIIKMPELVNFTELAHDIKKQFAEITPDYIQGKISEIERMMHFGRFVPLFIKKWVIKSIGHSISAGCTTGFSNLGLIKLPKEVQEKVDMFSFALGAESNMPYQFACVATGDTLTLTATTTAVDTGIIMRIGNAVKAI